MRHERRRRWGDVETSAIAADLVVRHAYLITMDDAGTLIQDGAAAIDGRRIVGVGRRPRSSGPSAAAPPIPRIWSPATSQSTAWAPPRPRSPGHRRRLWYRRADLLRGQHRPLTARRRSCCPPDCRSPSSSGFRQDGRACTRATAGSDGSTGASWCRWSPDRPDSLRRLNRVPAASRQFMRRCAG